MAVSYAKLPHNPETEKATLGSVLMSKSACDETLSTLQVEDFFDENHRKIYQAIINVNAKGNAVDVQTVTEELKNLKALEDVGGVDYLYELTQSMLSPDNVKEYNAILKQNANLRNLLLAMKDIEEDYLKRDIDDYTAFVGQVQKKIDKICEERKISNFASSKEIVDKVQQQIYTIAERRKDRDWTGVDTGFGLLNYYTNGLQPQNLIIVAGRPGLGKTAFALQLALNAAMKDKVPVAIFEMEMSAVMLYSRLLSNLSDVKSRDILSGKFETKQKVAINENLEKLAKLKIFVDESSALTIYDIIAKARKLKSEQPDLGLIIIDYLGLIASDAKRRGRYDSRQLEIQDYTRSLHELARDLNIPIVLLCQLNRKVEDRGEGGTPRLSDLRESGAIEQDAEIVLLLHRDDYGRNELVEKHEREKAKAKDMSPEARRDLVAVAQKRVEEENAKANQDEMKKNSPILHVIIAKNRNGESDRTVDLMFEKEYSRFRDVSKEYRERKKQILGADYLDEE
ncbi:MAG: replicative DNA helicase [Bacilli bacterium]|nr:replicative DNA helicase [Bacilli bacterium]